jgi:predicted nucleic acid-binding Zn ribbon protein
MKDSSRKAGEILKDLLDGNGKGWIKEDPYSPIFLEWGSIAGTALADNCRPVEIRDGICIVEADHPGWLQLLAMEKDRLLKAIRQKSAAAGVHDIRFKLSSGYSGSH